MSSYKYYAGGIYLRKVYVRNGWQRFHTMNAQYQYGRFANEYHVGHYQERYDFISYATPICHAFYDSFNNHWNISINRAYFDCSSSTSKQFNRWLRENHIPTDLYELKRLDRCKEFENHTNIDTRDNVTIYWHDSESIERMF